MKTTIPILALIAWFVSGCSSTRLKHVDAETFLRYASPMGGMYSAEYATYLGSSRDRVYIEHENYITFVRKGPVTTIYWTEIDSLPVEVIKKIKTGQAPWIPFDHRRYAREKVRPGTIDFEQDIPAEPVPVRWPEP